MVSRGPRDRAAPVTSEAVVDQGTDWLPQEPFIFVTVGTDHHRFGRLMAWLDEWCLISGRPPCVVQSGSSVPPSSARSRAFLPAETMQEAMTGALAVVCHGGPATIMQARSAGRLPIVVPRRKLFDEHVDDHQVWFTARLAELGDIVVADEKQSLHAHLERAAARPEEYLLAPGDVDVSATVRRFATAVEPLVRRRRPHRGRMPRMAEQVET